MLEFCLERTLPESESSSTLFLLELPSGVSSAFLFLPTDPLDLLLLAALSGLVLLLDCIETSLTSLAASLFDTLLDWLSFLPLLLFAAALFDLSALLTAVASLLLVLLPLFS